MGPTHYSQQNTVGSNGYPSSGFATGLLNARKEHWQLGLPHYIDAQKVGSLPAIIAVGGGKGGVGKSLISANLATCLARTGRKVLAIDFDIGGANLHTYFGMPGATSGLSDVIIGRQRQLHEVAAPTKIHGLSLVAGGGEEFWGGVEVLNTDVLRYFFDQLTLLKHNSNVDIVILDLGAGTAKYTRDLFLMSHLGLVTLLPEPTSVENVYLFLKNILLDLVENAASHVGVVEDGRQIRKNLLATKVGHDGSKLSYYMKLMESRAHFPELVQTISSVLASRQFGVVVNQIRNQKDIDLGKSIELITERYFGLSTFSCGHLNYDECAWKALRNRRILLEDFPTSNIAKKFQDLARTSLVRLGY